MHYLGLEKTNEIQKKRTLFQSVAIVQTINAEEVRMNLRDAKLSHTRWREIFKGGFKEARKGFSAVNSACPMKKKHWFSYQKSDVLSSV